MKNRKAQIQILAAIILLGVLVGGFFVGRSMGMFGATVVPDSGWSVQSSATVPGPGWPYSGCPTDSSLMDDQPAHGVETIYYGTPGVGNYGSCTTVTSFYHQVGEYNNTILEYDVKTGCQAMTYCVNAAIIKTCDQNSKPMIVMARNFAAVGYNAWTYSATCVPNGLTTTIPATTTTINPVGPGQIVPPPVLTWIQNWIQNVLNTANTAWSFIRGVFGFSITGAGLTYTPGSQQNIQISISGITLQPDYTQGNTVRALGLWYVLDANKNIVTTGNWEEITTSTWAKDISLKMPNTVGDYYMVANVITYTQTYANGNWTTSDPVLSKNEAIKFTIGYPQPPATTAISAISAVAGSQTSFTAHATNPNGGTLVWSLSGAPSGALINSATGVFTWTPQSSGTYTFNVQVTDGLTTMVSTPVSVTVSLPGPGGITPPITTTWITSILSFIGNLLTTITGWFKFS